MKIITPLISENELEKEKNQFEALILDLITNKYAFLDNFIDQDILLGLRSNIDLLYKNDALHLSGLGKKSVYQLNKK